MKAIMNWIMDNLPIPVLAFIGLFFIVWLSMTLFHLLFYWVEYLNKIFPIN